MMKVNQVERENKNKSDDYEEIKHEKPNLKGDYQNLMLLFVLYVLQGKILRVLCENLITTLGLGVPMGISSSMTVMLQNRGVSYYDQTIFSFAVYPFTRKLSHKNEN